IASLMNTFNQSEKQKLQEKNDVNSYIQILGEVCDKNKLKLDEIQHKILSAGKKMNTNKANPYCWVSTVQASTIEDLANQNKELTDVLKKLIFSDPNNQNLQKDLFNSQTLSSECHRITENTLTSKLNHDTKGETHAAPIE